MTFFTKLFSGQLFSGATPSPAVNSALSAFDDGFEDITGQAISEAEIVYAPLYIRDSKGQSFLNTPVLDAARKVSASVESYFPVAAADEKGTWAEIRDRRRIIKLVQAGVSSKLPLKAPLKLNRTVAEGKALRYIEVAHARYRLFIDQVVSLINSNKSAVELKDSLVTLFETKYSKAVYKECLVPISKLMRHGSVPEIINELNTDINKANKLLKGA